MTYQLHPRHMTDGELAQAYDEVIFTDEPDSLYDQQVIQEHNNRINIIQSRH